MINSWSEIITNSIKDTLGSPYSLFLTILVCLFIIILFISIFSKALRNSLVKYKILEPQESPSKLLFLIISILLLVRLFQAYVLQPFLVDGGSMLPTLQSGELLLIDKLSFDIDNLKRGDVIVFRHIKPDRYNGKFFIKRLIALPGDKVVVQNGITTIYNQANPNGEILDESFIKYKDNVTNFNLTLGPNEYVAFGDNRAESYDSRSWGVIDKKDISGKAVFRLYPFNKIATDPGEVGINFIKR